MAHSAASLQASLAVALDEGSASFLTTSETISLAF
jgi:hypothetical protein